MIVWLLWYRQNQIRTGATALPLNLVLTQAYQMLQDFHRAKPTNVVPQSPPTGSPITWTPPLPPSLKINYDGAVFKETKEAGIGVVIKDSTGQVIASMVERVSMPQTVAEVEALAARRVVKFAKELYLQSIIVEGDSELITRALQQEGPSFACYGQLIEETQELFGLFNSCNVTDVRRKGNSLAHNLARHVSSLLVWMEEVPPHLNNVLIADYG